MPTIDANRLREFTAVLQKYKAGKASLERRVVAAENWWKLRNRQEERRGGLGDEGGFKSESGWLHNVIVSKHADAMDAFPEPVILPREPGDRDEARLLSAILPCILEQNRFERTYDQAMWQKLKTGTAAYRVIWDPDKLSGLGDIAIERVDLLNLFWEPGVGDIQDSKYLFCTHLEDEDALTEQYPQLKGRMKSSPFLATRFVYDDAVSLEGKATVIEVYYKKRRPGRDVLHYCKYVGDCVLYATENNLMPSPGGDAAPMPSPGGDAAPMPSPGGEGAPVRTLGRMRWEPDRLRNDWSKEPGSTSSDLRLAGDGEGHLPLKGKAIATSSVSSLAGNRDEPPSPQGEGMATASTETGLYAHGRYPFVLDPLFPVEGSPCGYGFVDLCRNAQTAIDLLRTAFIKNALVGATPRYFERIDGAVNEEEFLDLQRPVVHVAGNLGEDSLRQIGFAGLPGVYVNVLESSIRELRETSGNTETATGNVHSGVTAASAIAALQEASGKGSRDATRASYLAFAEIVELCIELIRQFYTLPRQFRITGAAGDDYVLYSNAALRPRPLLLGGDVPAGMSAPVFDVKVKAQKRSAYSRLSQNELAMELYRLGLFEQGREQQTLACLELMDFDGKDAIVQRVQEALARQDRLRELERYRALALALAQRYRPDLALGLLGEEPAVPPDEAVGDAALRVPSNRNAAPGAEINARAAVAERVQP